MPFTLLLAAALATQTPPAFDPRAAVFQALTLLHDADTNNHRYTYFQKITMANLNRAGRPVEVTNRRYEVTYINDHPYMKLIEVDNQPLTGDALKEEQKRYDKAIHKKKDLDAQKRSTTDDFKIVKPDFEIPMLLTLPYLFKETSTEPTADGDTLHLIEATPDPAAKRKTKCPWHVRLWISAKTGLMMHYVTDVSGDTNPYCINSTEEERYIVVDGLPKTSKHAGRMNMQDERGNGYFAYEFLDAFTDYRRFHATVTLGEATELPDKTSPPPPPEK